MTCGPMSIGRTATTWYPMAARDTPNPGRTPFLKWPGGKRWLVPEIRQRIGRIEGTYYEPFLGSAAVFFALAPTKAVLSDINSELVELFEAMRDSPAVLQERLSVHQTKHNKDYYYQTRAGRPEDVVDRAARMLYLNRTCFNGIWRVNHQGEFNVPIGTKTSIVFDGESFSEIAEVLTGVELHAQDFERTIKLAGHGDVIYADPPYTVAHNNNGFTKYNDKIFSWEDQIRLRDALKAARERGASAVVSNANHKSIRRLYQGFESVDVIRRNSVIAGIGEGRGPTSELLISAGSLRQ